MSLGGFTCDLTDFFGPVGGQLCFLKGGGVKPQPCDKSSPNLIASLATVDRFELHTQYCTVYLSRSVQKFTQTVVTEV